MACSVEERQALIDAAKMNLKRLGKLREAGHLVDIDADNADIHEAIESMYGIAQGNISKIKPLATYQDVTKFAKSRYVGGIVFRPNDAKNEGDKAIKQVFERNGTLVVTTEQGWQFKFLPGNTRSEKTKAGHTADFKEIEEVRYWLPEKKTAATHNKEVAGDYVYHGTRAPLTALIDSEGNMVFKPSKNFSGKTQSVSFTTNTDVANRYAGMLKGKGPYGYDFKNAKIIKIATKYLPILERENDEEVAVNTPKDVVIPKEAYQITEHPLSQKLKAYDYTYAEYMRENFPGSEEDYDEYYESYLEAIEESDPPLGAALRKEIEYLHAGEYTTFGSKKKEQKVNWKELDKLEENPHGNPELMVGLLDKLHIMDGNKESAEHMEHLRGLLGGLNPEFFNKMTTYIKDKATETHGMVQGNNLGIYVSGLEKVAGNEMGAAETYAHEIVHAFTVFAMEQAKNESREARKLIRELDHIMAEVQKQNNWTMFMPKESVDKEAEKKIAKERYEYVFASENAKAEFLAHALTNPEMMEALKGMTVDTEVKHETMMEKIIGFFHTVWDIVLGNYEFGDKNKLAYEHVFNLSMRLGEINNKNLYNAKGQMTVMEDIAELMDTGNMAIHDALQGVIKKYGQDDTALRDIDPDASKLEKVKWHADHLLKVMRNETYRNYFGLVLSQWGVNPEGLLRDWGRAFMESSDMQKKAEWLGLQSDTIDRVRNTMIGAAKQELVARFKQAPTAAQERAMTKALLNTDAQTLLKKYKVSEIRELLTDDTKLDKRINKVKELIKDLDEKRYNWLTNQAHGLGYFMVTGESHIAQMMNAYSITTGILSTEIVKMGGKEKLIGLVDELATLTAIKYTDKTERSTAAELAKVEWRGVEGVLKTHRGFIEDSHTHLFKKDPHRMIKGYTKEQFDDKYSTEIAPVAKREEMEDRMFRMVGELPKAKEDGSEPMALYVSDAFIVNEWHRSNTRLTGFNRKGTSLKEVRYKEDSEFDKERWEIDKIKMDKARWELVKKLEEGEYDPQNEYTGMAPVLDSKGNVVDYRYMMKRSTKEDLLEQDLTATTVLAKSMGNVIDKMGSEAHNKKVIELIKEDMKENYEGGVVGKNGLEYVEIGPFATVTDAKEIYAVLPQVFKDAINDMPGHKMAVPRELMHLLFGYRHLSITDIPGLDKITTPMMRSMIKMVETMWIEAMKILKGNILLKMPIVLITNMVSNIMYALATGNINPVELFNDYKESFRDIRQYIKADRELAKLTVRMKNGTATQADKTRAKVLEGVMKDSPIKELMDIGLYQAVIEDVETMKVEGTNRWKKAIDEKLEGAPAMIKTGLQWAYLSEETSWYKVNQEVLQMTDLIARDVENRRMKKLEQQQARGGRKLPQWWTEANGDEKVKGAKIKEFLAQAEKVRHQGLLENYINYNIPSSRIEEYLNRMGAIMFTKFTKRIQKVIAKSSYTHPINMLMILLGQEYLLDVESIHDQSVFTRSWYNVGMGAGDSVPFFNPLDHIARLATPQIVNLTESRNWY